MVEVKRSELGGLQSWIKSALADGEYDGSVTVGGTLLYVNPDSSYRTPTPVEVNNPNAGGKVTFDA